MIRILDRYVVRNFLAPFTYCLLAFIMLFIIGDLFENLSDFLEVPSWFLVILHYYALFIPSILVYITAVAVLLALLYSIGKMQRHNEISAMRAGGISIFRIALPLLIVSVLLSLLVLYVNETIVPHTMKQTGFLKESQIGSGLKSDEILRYVPYYTPLTNRSFYFETFDTARNMAEGVNIYEQKPDGKPAKRISAHQAAWRDGRWWLFDGVIYTFSPEGRPQKKVLTKEAFDFDFRPEDLKESWEDLATMSFGEIKQLLERKRGHPLSTLRPALVELQQKIALPLACIIMGLLGMAFGLKIGKGGMLAGVGISLVLGFLYYVLYSVAVALGKQGYLPPWLAAWAGNLVFGITGVVMLIRAN